MTDTQLKLFNANPMGAKPTRQSVSAYYNVQQLDFILPEDGDYGIRVVNAGQIFGTAGSESYGLAWSAVAIPNRPAFCCWG